MTKKAATCIAIDEARAETPFSATLGTEANEAVRMKLTATPESLVVEIGLVGLKRPLGRQGAEFLMAVTLRHLRELIGRDIRPIRAAFAHARNADLPEFARFFGCPAELGRAQSVAAAAAFPVQCFRAGQPRTCWASLTRKSRLGRRRPHGAPHPLGMVGRTQAACLKMIDDHNINLINLVEG